MLRLCAPLTALRRTAASLNSVYSPLGTVCLGRRMAPPAFGAQGPSAKPRPFTTPPTQACWREGTRLNQALARFSERSFASASNAYAAHALAGSVGAEAQETRLQNVGFRSRFARAALVREFQVALSADERRDVKEFQRRLAADSWSANQVSFECQQVAPHHALFVFPLPSSGRRLGFVLHAAQQTVIIAAFLPKPSVAARSQ